MNYCEHFSELYGKEFLSYNVHAAVHLADESRTHGVLDNVSCFVFKNYLGRIKKLLRKPDAPVQQVVKRLLEMSVRTPATRRTGLQKPHHDGPVPCNYTSYRQFEEFHGTACTVSLNLKDSCVLIDGKPAVVRNFLQHADEWLVVYQLFSDFQCFFNYPLPSDHLRIFSVSSQFQDIAVAPTAHISRKCCYLRDGSQHFIIPLLH